MYSKKDFTKIKNIILSAQGGLKGSNITKVILFGSYATKSADEYSDIDLILLLSKNISRTEKLKLLGYLWNKLAQDGYEVDLIIKSNQEYEKTKKYIGTISNKISKEGKVLWEKV
jgi:predicted nucleotidyltransferase